MKGRPTCSYQPSEYQIDELFETKIRPLRSKNARTIFLIFVDAKSVDFLTTFDLQSKLEGIGIRITKKEINGWLHSLYKAGLITKEEERGKPTTLAYDDKYTFDMWRLTTVGEEIAEGIDFLLSRRTKPPTFHPEKIIYEIAQTNQDVRQQIFNNIEEIYTKLSCLRILWGVKNALTWEDLRERLHPTDEILKKTISSYLVQGFVSEIDIAKTNGLLTKLLRLLGLKRKQPISFQLTEEGQKLAEELLSSN